jgi:hypothetical protein
MEARWVIDVLPYVGTLEDDYGNRDRRVGYYSGPQVGLRLVPCGHQRDQRPADTP